MNIEAYKPTKIDISETARFMLWQLEQNGLRVELCESEQTCHNGRLVRVATSRNPQWYREFCRQHSPTNRTRIRQRKKHDTYIKRNHTLRALRELMAGKCETVYAERLRPFVERELKRLVTAVENGKSYF